MSTLEAPKLSGIVRPGQVWKGRQTGILRTVEEVIDDNTVTFRTGEAHSLSEHVTLYRGTWLLDCELVKDVELKLPYTEALEKLASEGRSIYGGVPEPRHSNVKPSFQMEDRTFARVTKPKPELGELKKPDMDATLVECFCRYKGLTEAEFRDELLSVAEEYNAFCAGFKAGRFLE